jgi:hypothetical protein
MVQSTERDDFIALPRGELIDLLTADEDLAPDEHEQLHRLARLLQTLFHFQYHQRMEVVKAAYAPFDPDAQPRALNPAPPEERQQKMSRFFTELAWLMERADYKHLSCSELEPALGGTTESGIWIDVDFHAFERLAIFARGDTTQKRMQRSLRRFYRAKEVEVAVYPRLVMALKLRQHQRLGRIVDEDSVYLQIFKDIPKRDVTMLLPGARVRLRYLDQGKIGLPLLTGLFFALLRIIQDVVDFFTHYVLQLLLLEPAAIWAVATGSIGYSLRTYYGYVRTKQRYALTLTEILYFQNLDTNAGVLFRILDDAEEQVCREAILAYYFLWRAGNKGLTSEGLKEAVEQCLAKRARLRVEFSPRQVLAQLQKWQLVTQAEDRYRTLAPAEALAQLESIWGSFV